MTKLSLLVLLVVLPTGCTAGFDSEPTDEVLDEPLGSSAQSLSSDPPPKEGCSSSRTTKLNDAYKFLVAETTTYKTELKDCIAKAKPYMLEYEGSTASTIFNDFVDGQPSKIRCVDADTECNGTTAYLACARARDDVVDVKKAVIDGASTRLLASYLAHEFTHMAGYRHVANPDPLTTFYYYNTVPPQVENCVHSAGSDHSGPRAPWPFLGPGDGPTMSGIVGMHSNDACNCVYLSEGYATCGATDYLTKSTNRYQSYELYIHWEPKYVVGMTQTGSLVCVFYGDKTVSCGTQSGCEPVGYLADTREPYTYSLPENPETPGVRYKPTDIVGMAGDDTNNNILTWYKNGYVSMGTTDNLGKSRKPERYTLPAGYTPSMIVEMIADGSFICAFYNDKKVSCGTSTKLASSRAPYSTKF
jgi:hypothetical protein